MGKSFFNQGGDHLLLGLVTAAPAEQAAHERDDEDEGESCSQSAALTRSGLTGREPTRPFRQ